MPFSSQPLQLVLMKTSACRSVPKKLRADLNKSRVKFHEFLAMAESAKIAHAWIKIFMGNVVSVPDLGGHRNGFVTSFISFLLFTPRSTTCATDMIFHRTCCLFTLCLVRCHHLDFPEMACHEVDVENDGFFANEVRCSGFPSSRE